MGVVPEKIILNTWKRNPRTARLSCFPSATAALISSSSALKWTRCISRAKAAPSTVCSEPREAESPQWK